MACTDVASGTRVSLTYTEEPNCGVRPPALATPVDNIAADKTGSAAGEMEFTRAAGSFVDDGFLPLQRVRVAGFAATANNITWIVKSVAATLLTVYDPDDVGVDEVAAGGQTVQIQLSTLRATGRQLDLTKDTLESEEVRPSRQFSDVRHGFNQVEGSPGYEISNISYTDMIRAVMSGEWETPTYDGGNLGITADTPSAGFARLDRATGDWEDDGYRVGDIVETTGFANAVNNRQWRVVTVSGQNMDVYVPTGITPITEAAAGSRDVVFPGARIDIGTTLRTFTFEQRFDDIEAYREYNGVTVNEMSWSISPESIINGTFGLLGMSGGEMLAASVMDPLTPAPAPTTTPFAAFDGEVFEGGEKVAVVTSVEFSINNNRTLEGVVGSKFSPGVFEGRCSVEGTLVAFLRGTTIYNKFYNESESSLWIRLQDPDDLDEFMNVVFPRVKYTSSDMDPPQEGPVPLNMGFRALETTVKDASGVDIATSLTIQSSRLR